MPSPQAPQLLKGALVTVDPDQPTPRTLAFQYNPDTLQRTLQPQLVGGQQQERSQVVRFSGAPIEVITVDVEIDYVDESGIADASKTSQGIYPLLSALELIAYPKSTEVVSQANLLASGMLEIAPSPAPLTLFVWGQKRVVPVALVSYTITEQAFDQNLTPIRAGLSLRMRVLSYSDLAPENPGYSQFLVYQRAKEALAEAANSSTGSNVTGAGY